MKAYIYSALSIPVYAVLYVFTGISVLICLLLSIMGQSKALKEGIWCWANGVFLIMGRRLHIYGFGNYDRQKRFLLLANHSSLFDIMAVMAVCPGVSWFGRDRLIKIPVFGYFLKSINYIPMRTASLSHTKYMINQLVDKTKENTIAIFPEGTRSMDGAIQDFKKGFIHVLKASELDILPITLKGLYELKPKNRFYINFDSRIEVIIHQPIPRESLICLSDKEIISSVKNIIRFEHQNNIVRNE